MQVTRAGYLPKSFEKSANELQGLLSFAKLIADHFRRKPLFFHEIRLKTADISKLQTGKPTTKPKKREC